MRTRQEAVDKAADFNAPLTPLELVTRHYGVDQSSATGAWRVIEYREHYAPKVVAS